MKRFNITALLIVFCLITSMSEKGSSGKYTSDKGKVSFFSETPVENINASSSKMLTVIDPTNGNVACVISISTFNFDNSLMKDHFNEKYLETDKYPKATFAGVIQEKVDWATPGKYIVNAKGKLKIHGVEKERTIQGTLTVINKNKIRLDSKFDVVLADHYIEIPELVFTKIAQVISVEMNADLDLK